MKPIETPIFEINLMELFEERGLKGELDHVPY